jgi:hypothetical protein
MNAGNLTFQGYLTLTHNTQCDHPHGNVMSVVCNLVGLFPSDTLSHGMNLS